MVAPLLRTTVSAVTPTRAVVLDPHSVELLLRERRRTGAIRRDEVWEGTLHVVPNPSLEHPKVVGDLRMIFRESIRDCDGALVLPETNTADPVRGLDDLRIPDLVIVLPESKVRRRESFLAGGPDLVVEVLSPGDETVEKIPFYARIGVRELLVVDPERKTVDVFRHDGESLSHVGGAAVESVVARVRFETMVCEGEPTLRVTARDGRSWTIGPLKTAGSS
jgi:Uma2 family endonuclease